MPRAAARAAARAAFAGLLGLLAVAGLAACRELAGPGPAPQRPQTVVLIATPKFIRDFAAPEADVERFLRHYAPLTARAAQTVVVFAVGNSQHILTYRGASFASDTVAWARYTEGRRTFDQVMRYDQLAGIVRAFHERAAELGIRLKVFDQIDPGNEFTLEFWKFDDHPECMDLGFMSFDIRGRLKADTAVYASAPRGAPAGKPCGEFVVDQVGAYMRDLGLDGILYGNQFGTRGRWLPGDGPGHTPAEEAAIRDFLAYSKRVYGDREVMWFDSYNNVRVERDTWSFPPDGYGYFDYVIASGFCVITHPARYLDNLRSKLRLPDRPPVLATLDYVDPWYTYDAMTAYPDESAQLERTAIAHQGEIDGVVFFANDHHGALVPRALIESFAARYYPPLPGAEQGTPDRRR